MLQEVSVRQCAWLCKNAWRLLSLTLTCALCCVNDRYVRHQLGESFGGELGVMTVEWV